MPMPLLATKLYIPTPKSGIVPRPRLVERLNEGLQRKLTLISAPAGFGKTSLVSQWLASCDRPAAWLSLDEEDSEPNRFLTYTIAALQTVTDGTGTGAMAMLQSPQPPAVEAILTNLVNDLSSISSSFILVLDDYHLVVSQAVDQCLQFLVEHLPPQMHLVMATREDPSLPLARYRARGQLTELRLTDLRFSAVEAAEFLNQMMGLDLSEDDITALEARTEGWIAGLQLAAISMRGLPDAANFIQSFTGSHRFVLDYLLEEVLQRQPVEIQTFLLATSILERLCGPLCDAVLNLPTDAGQTTLEYLERANLFIVPLDNERRWYRYHHLFGDILRQRLGHRHSPAEIADFHLRASVWCEQNGYVAEAFQHALSAGEFGRAAGLAETAWPAMEDSFQTGAWLRWIKKLPEDVTQIRPVLSTQIARSLADAGDSEASETCLQAAERCLNGSPDEMIVEDAAQLAPLPAVIALTRAYNAQIQGDLAATVKYAELALRLVPEGDLLRRAQAAITLEITHWTTGDLESARTGLADWMNSMQEEGNYVFVVASGFALADLLVEQGRLRQAVKTYHQSLKFAAEHGKEAQQITAHHHLGLAMLYHEMGEDNSAAMELQKAREMGEHTTLVDWTYRWHLAQARLKESAGDLEAALAQFDEAKRAYVKTLIPDAHPIEALKANVYLKQGRLDLARDWVDAHRLSVEDEISYLNEFEHLVLARVLIADAQSNRSPSSVIQAIKLLERLVNAAEAQKRMGNLIEILVTQALAYQAQGSISMARAALERALDLAQPEGYVRLFVDQGQPMRLLLSELRTWIEKQASSHGRALFDYAGKLLSAFDPTVRTSPTSHPNKAELIEPLSERELEVLRLVAKGLTNTEISQRLVLAVSTVKGHNLRIFEKLQVENRTEAVMRARQLGLL